MLEKRFKLEFSKSGYSSVVAESLIYSLSLVVTVSFIVDKIW